MTTALALALAVAAPQKADRPAQIILFRHAEKPADKNDPHLSAVGVRRARLLVRFLTSNPVVNKFGKPVAIFATRTTQDGDGRRTQETVAPAAAALKLKVQTPVIARDFKELPQHVLDNPAFAGKTVVIAWNHDELADLAAALGVSPKPPAWKAGEYDQVYVITYRGKKATLDVIGQNLKP